jgi:hypothetical protein
MKDELIGRSGTTRKLTAGLLLFAGLLTLGASRSAAAKPPGDT